MGYLQDKQRTNKKKITTKPKLLAHLQNKRNQNGNRHKTKNKYSIKSKKQKAGDNRINLPNSHVSDGIKSILNKGLKFVPKPKPIGYQSVYTSYLQYRRNMYLQYHYRLSNNNHIRHPFKAKSYFTPPLPDNANLLQYTCDGSHHQIIRVCRCLSKTTCTIHTILYQGLYRLS